MTISEIIFNNYALKEMQGPEQNTPEIINFFKALGKTWVKTDETAWCAAFANYVLMMAGFPHTGELFAKSFLALGEQISVPRPLGSSNDFVDIALFWRGKPWTNYRHEIEFFEPGHVTFPLKERGNLIYAVGGNQGNMVKVSGYDLKEHEQYRRIYRTVV